MSLDIENFDNELVHARLVSAAIKRIRLMRRMRSSEVADAMELSVRTYEHFEAGRGKLTYSRISRFARATNSDPVAIFASIPLRSADFALGCIDNKLMTVVMTCMRELDQELGEDISRLPVSVLVATFDKLSKELISHVKRRDEYAEKWMQEKASQIDGASFLSRPNSTD